MLARISLIFRCYFKKRRFGFFYLNIAFESIGVCISVVERKSRPQAGFVDVIVVDEGDGFLLAFSIGFL